MPKIFFTFGLFIVLVLIFCSCSFFSESGKLRHIVVGDHDFWVQVADTPLEKSRGLSGRESLPDNQGMLFVYKEPQRVSFWMKDMLIPLDFIWVRSGEVIRVDENVSRKNLPPPASITPKKKVDTVLEVNAGTIEKYDIKVGNKFPKYPTF